VGCGAGALCVDDRMRMKDNLSKDVPSVDFAEAIADLGMMKGFTKLKIYIYATRLGISMDLTC
jgi:hypothetical protein